jgi:3-isopropylmalate/(R)-2-methylmalate dehydratase small subunit
VIAQSFARIFYRNAINVGLPVLETSTEGIETGDGIEVDLEKGTVTNVTKGETLRFEPLPPVMIRILMDGGLVGHITKHGDFQV